MNKICLIFDYFKEAFHINKENKKIYRPQIALIILKTLILVGCALTIYSYIGDNKFADYNANKWIYFGITTLLGIILILLSLAIISLLVECGLYNMYKMCVLKNELKPGDFGDGIKKYFFKFLLGDLLIALAWMIIFIPYLIIGTITLSVGLTIIPLVIDIFLTMWKVSIVMNENDVITAIKDSFYFAKKNFFSLTVLQLIHWAFVKGATSSTGFNSFYNFGNNNTNSANNISGANPNISTPSIETIIRIVKIVCAILIPIISIAAFVGSIINMLFEVFFSLVIFIAYIKKFEKEDNMNTVEVNSHVV